MWLHRKRTSLFLEQIEDCEVRYSFALSSFECGQVQAGIENLRKVLQVNPGHKKALALLAKIQERAERE